MNTEEPVFEDEKLKTSKAIQKKLSSVSKAIQNAQEQYQKSKDYAKALHTAELVKAHFGKLKRGMEQITVTDWLSENKEVTIPLNPLHTPQETLEELFVKSQKLKKAIVPLET
ncbi:MAG: NFACT family protein, partial [Chlamydiales bacterium]|nr:NFACT family protein [Chlamydiales bacterium]